MANVPGNDGETHVDLGFEIKQVRCNARDLAKTLQELVQEEADAEGTPDMVENYYLKIFRLSDNDDFLIVYVVETQE